MRIFCMIICLATLWACSSGPQTESPSSEPENWFFWAVDWHPHKDQLVAGGTQDTLRLISAHTFELLHNYPYKGTITKAKWHPTKQKVAVSVQDGVSESTILDFEEEQTIKLDSMRSEGARAIGWNHTGDLLAIGDYEGFISIYDETGNFIKRVNTQQKAIIGLDWHPDENLIVAVGERITLYHYELDSLRHIDDRSEEVEVLMLCVAWHPSGTFFVTGDYGDFTYHYPPLLQYWSYEGQKIKSIERSKAEYRNLKWSGDGALLATASEKIRLWDQEGQLVAEAPSQDLLWGIDWNKDNSQIVATDESGKIIVWDRKLVSLRERSYFRIGRINNKEGC